MYSVSITTTYQFWNIHVSENPHHDGTFRIFWPSSLVCSQCSQNGKNITQTEIVVNLELLTQINEKNERINSRKNQRIQGRISDLPALTAVLRRVCTRQKTFGPESRFLGNRNWQVWHAWWSKIIEYIISNFRLWNISLHGKVKGSFGIEVTFCTCLSGTIIATVLNWTFRFSGSSWRPA